MKTATLIKSLAKNGIQLHQDGSRYYYNNEDICFCFWDQEGRAVAVHSYRIDNAPDSMRDFFPETYHRTIKSAVAAISEIKHLTKNYT